MEYPVDLKNLTNVVCELINAQQELIKWILPTLDYGKISAEAKGGIVMAQKRVVEAWNLLSEQEVLLNKVTESPKATNPS